jgi:hypothetical protein
MSLLRAMFESHGMKPTPNGVTFARTQWLLVFFWMPQTHVNVDMTAIVLLPLLSGRMWPYVLRFA